MITRTSSALLMVAIVLGGCSRDLPLGPTPEEIVLIDRICWEPEPVDTVYSSEWHPTNSVQLHLPGGLGLGGSPRFSLVAFRTDTVPGPGIGWNIQVQLRTYLPGTDTLGIRITSPLGSCDQPLLVGDSVSPYDPVYTKTNLYHETPSASCVATPSVRHIGFVRMVLGRKYAGHVRIRCIVTPDGLRRYWMDRVCMATEAGRTIDIQ
jgi:hypothetical protein